jgi:hypothetical protein
VPPLLCSARRAEHGRGEGPVRAVVGPAPRRAWLRRTEGEEQQRQRGGDGRGGSTDEVGTEQIDERRVERRPERQQV